MPQPRTPALDRLTITPADAQSAARDGAPSGRRVRTSKSAVAAVLEGFQALGIALEKVAITGSTIELYPASGSPDHTVEDAASRTDQPARGKLQPW